MKTIIQSLKIKWLIWKIKNLLNNKKAPFYKASFFKEFPNALKQIFNIDKAVMEKNSRKIMPLFKEIIAMGKADGAYGFYDLLTDSNLSFTKELLLYGIDHEPYYNTHDQVFVDFVIVAIRGLDAGKIVQPFLRSRDSISYKHFIWYRNVYKRALALREQHPSLQAPEIVEEVIEKIFNKFLETDLFYQTSLKAIAIVLLFGIEGQTETIKKIFKVYRDSILKESGSNDMGIDLLNGLSFALYHLTKEEKYERLCALSYREIKRPVDPFSPQQLDGIIKILTEEMNE